MSEQAQEAKGKKGGKMPLIIGMVVILFLNGLVVGKVFLGGGGSEKHTKEEKREEEVGEKVPLEEFLVNLADSGHYLKVTIALGLKEGVAGSVVEEELAPIRDAIVSVLSAQELEEITGEAGKNKLKKELVEKINEALEKEEVVKVYFMSFATQ